MVKGDVIESAGVPILTNPNECAHDNPNPSSVCINKDDAKIVVDAAKNTGIITSESGGGNNSAEEIIDNLQKKVESAKNCESASCVLSAVKEKVADIDPTKANKIATILNDNFLPPGPFNSTEWLSDKNIEENLYQFTKKYNNFAMLRFKMIDEFNNAAKDYELIKKLRSEGKTKIGFAANQDDSNGSGTHWVAIFMDFDPPQICKPDPNLSSNKCNIKEIGPGSYSSPFTIEFFNSAGGSIYKQVDIWATEIQKYLGLEGFIADIVTVSDIQHQKLDTECGVYTLYYIYSRLNGKPHTNFKDTHITGDPVKDEFVEVFRKSLFRHNPNESKSSN